MLECILVNLLKSILIFCLIFLVFISNVHILRGSTLVFLAYFSQILDQQVNWKWRVVFVGRADLTAYTPDHDIYNEIKHNHIFVKIETHLIYGQFTWVCISVKFKVLFISCELI